MSDLYKGINLRTLATVLNPALGVSVTTHATSTDIHHLG